MSTYEQRAIDAGLKLDKKSLAQSFLDNGGKIELYTANENTLHGSAQGSAKAYDFTVDFTDASKCTCICGYYLPYKPSHGDHSQLCTHQLAGIMAADNGLPIVARPQGERRQRTNASPRTSTTGQTVNTGHQSQAFKEKLTRAVDKAVRAQIVDPILDAWESGMIPFLVGLPGCGKTFGAAQTAPLISFTAFVEQTGAQSITDADLVGFMKDQQTKVPGLIARAFSQAREGKSVVIMMDEFARLNKRSQDAFLPAMVPVPASAARLQGIETDEPVYIVHAPLWGTEWAPCSKVRWVLGANPWGATFDPAMVDRIYPIDVAYDPNVLKYFDDAIKNAILKIWEMSSLGQLPLPMTYRGILKAKNGSDKSIFKVYLAKLKVLDQHAYGTVLDMLANAGLVDRPASAPADASDLSV